MPNQRKFIIDAKWWRRWCDYTGFNQCETMQIDSNIHAKHEALINFARFESDRDDTPPIEKRSKANSQLDNF